MRREGCDEDNLSPEDFLCDFCGQTWAPDRPMVEGHRGSLACARCLTLAFDELWNRQEETGAGNSAQQEDDNTHPQPPPSGRGLEERHPPVGTPCVMCLEQRDEPHWHSPVREDAWMCKRCAKQSVVMLERDPEAGFKRPPRR